MNSLPEIFHGDFISSAAASVLVEIFPVGISNWALFPYSLSLSPLLLPLLDFPQLSVVEGGEESGVFPQKEKGSPLPLIPPFPSIPYGGPFFPPSPSLSRQIIWVICLFKGKRGGEARERRWTVKGGEKGKSVKRGQSLFP